MMKICIKISLVLSSSLIFIFWNEVNYFMKSISDFVDVSSKIATTASALIAASTYYRKVKQESNHEIYHIVINTLSNNQFEVLISITNDSSINHSYSLKGMKLANKIKLSQLNMAHTHSFQGIFKLNNTKNLNNFINVKPNETIQIANLTVLKDPLLFKSSYLQIICKDEKGDSFNIPVETDYFK